MLVVMRTLSIAAAALAALLFAPVAHAQGGVGSSGMGQGQARIAARSDVRLSMESLPGTNGATMSALGQQVGGHMRQLRECYEETVSERPTVQGTLRMRFELRERGGPAVSVDNHDVEDAGLIACVTRQLRQVDCGSIRRPAGAIVQLELSNTAAGGVAESARRSQERREVQVTVDGDGNPSATGGVPRRGVRFTVTGEGRDATPAVVAAHRVLTTAMPGLTDCRRRAARRRQDPTGEISVTMRVRGGRPTVSRVTRSTVEEERTRRCVGRVLGRVQTRAEAGSSTVQARILFETIPE